MPAAILLAELCEKVDLSIVTKSLYSYPTRKIPPPYDPAVLYEIVVPHIAEK
jgi:hypothetical protein